MNAALIALGTVVYLVIGAGIARWLLGPNLPESRWWQIAAIVALWPLIVIFTVLILGTL